MSAARSLNLELVVLIIIQNLCRNGGADDEFVILVVKMMDGKMSAFSRRISHSTSRPRTIPTSFLQAYCYTPFSQQGALISYLLFLHYM